MSNVKEMQKKINGKIVKWIGDGLELEALVYWPPKGDKLVLKPYGYKDEELESLFKNAGYGTEDMNIGDPAFCLTEYVITCKGEWDEETDEKMAELISEIPEGGVFDFDELITTSTGSKRSGLDKVLGRNPACPYV